MISILRNKYLKSLIKKIKVFEIFIVPLIKLKKDAVPKDYIFLTKNNLILLFPSTAKSTVKINNTAEPLSFNGGQIQFRLERICLSCDDFQVIHQTTFIKFFSTLDSGFQGRNLFCGFLFLNFQAFIRNQCI